LHFELDSPAICGTNDIEDALKYASLEVVGGYDPADDQSVANRFNL